MTLEITQLLDRCGQELKTKGKCYLACKVQPGANHTEIVGLLADDTLKINLAAQAQNNKANLELSKFCVQLWPGLAGECKIISGAADRRKLLKITALQ